MDFSHGKSDHGKSDHGKSDHKAKPKSEHKSEHKPEAVLKADPPVSDKPRERRQRRRTKGGEPV